MIKEIIVNCNNSDEASLKSVLGLGKLSNQYALSVTTYRMTKSCESISAPQLLLSSIPEFPTMAQRLWCWFFIGEAVGRRL